MNHLRDLSKRIPGRSDSGSSSSSSSPGVRAKVTNFVSSKTASLPYIGKGDLLGSSRVEARPLSTLRHPATFAPPPKRVGTFAGAGNGVGGENGGDSTTPSQPPSSRPGTASAAATGASVGSGSAGPVLPPRRRQTEPVPYVHGSSEEVNDTTSPRPIPPIALRPNSSSTSLAKKKPPPPPPPKKRFLVGSGGAEGVNSANVSPPILALRHNVLSGIRGHGLGFDGARDRSGSAPPPIPSSRSNTRTLHTDRREDEEEEEEETPPALPPRPGSTARRGTYPGGESVSSSPSSVELNIVAMRRLGEAGVRVPELGIGRRKPPPPPPVPRMRREVGVKVGVAGV
ncbi:hypothetical protein BDZ91DRAFT_796946 [Kalaharituber pfeilii]|nr:hypothetical protein BDZ91DRAFT_796946 [Kalaharituber pfeilii]